MRTLSLLLTVVVGLSPSSDGWNSPLPGGSITRLFNLRNGPYQAGHRGIDLEATQGRRVVAPVSGEVVFVGNVVDRPVVTLRVSGSLLVSVEPVHSELVVGDWIERGQTLGNVHGWSHCGFSCLHMGVREDETYVNPLRFFREFRPRLLPLGEP